MCTLNLTFDVPDTKAIDIEVLRKQMYAFFNILVATPSVLKGEQAKSWTEEFRGKWKDDNMTAEDFVKEIRANREIRKVVEL